MMDYITSEQFLQQPEKVQKAFMDWWKPERLDLVAWDVKGFKRIYVVNKYHENSKSILPLGSPDIWNDMSQCIPLFTESQLRKFIEDKTGGIDEIIHYRGVNEYSIKVANYKDDEYDNVIFEDLKGDLLQAYWKAACKIAGE